MLKVARQIPAEAVLIILCTRHSGDTTHYGGGETSQLDLPSLTPLSIADGGRLQLGVPHWATSVDYYKQLIIDPTFCGSRFSTGRLLAIEYFTFYSLKGQRDDGIGIESVSVTEALLMLTLLKYLVIPLPEYCCQLWNPWKSKDIQAIEAIQRTFTQRITEVQRLNYWERLHEDKLYSLQRHRERYIIKYICKTTQHMVPNIYDTTGNKITTRKHTRHGTQCFCYSVPDKQKPGTIPSRKCNKCIWASGVQLVAKIFDRHRKC